MKKIALMLAAAILLLAGCNKNNSEDARDLLKTVPSSASFVAVADLESILEKSGSEVKDGEITPSPEVQSAVAASKDADFKRLANLFLSNNSGVDPTVSLFFADGYAVYNTGLIKDTSKFRAAVEKEWNAKFTETDGMASCGKVVMMDNRYWILMSGRSSIEPSDIKRYASLSESQSFLSSKFADNVTELKSDLQGWVDINGAMNIAGLDFQSRAMTKLAMESLFSDAGYGTFSLDFQKGKLEARLNVLNADGKYAKYLFPVAKIDLAEVDRIGGTADILMAMAIPQKLVKQLKEQVSGQPSMLSIMMSALQPLDGTSAVALSENGSAMKAAISTTGDNTTDLMSLLQASGAKVEKKDKVIFATQGVVQGQQTVKDLSKTLEGDAAGVVVGKMKDTPAGFKVATTKLVPENGSMVLQVEVSSDNDKDNILVTLLKNSK